MKVVSYGGGTNSTAMIIGLVQLGIMPDKILFADTGGEKPQTYEFIETFQDWLHWMDAPPITIVKGQNPQQVADGGLYEECMRLQVLPSRTYGFGGCSMKWKRDPQERYLRHLPEAKAVWAAGDKITQYIGYDADEPHRADRPNFDNHPKYNYEFPLIEWDWGRDECLKAIDEAGLPRPGKSACFFCPSMKQHEIRELALTNPELVEKAIAMERNAAQKHRKVAGLGRHWSWENLLATDDMFADAAGLSDMPCDCFDGD